MAHLRIDLRDYDPRDFTVVEGHRIYIDVFKFCEMLQTQTGLLHTLELERELAPKLKAAFEQIFLHFIEVREQQLH